MVAASVGPTEILIVLGIVVLLFGAKKLPELARSVGRSSSEFRKGVQEGGADDEDAPASSERRTESGDQSSSS